MAEKKKEKKEVEMTKIEVEKLACMKAERDAMRLTIRNQEYEIQEKCKELEETKDTLREMVKRLGETRDLLHSSLQLQAYHKDVADGCVDMIREFLFKWLTKQNQMKLKKMLQFHQMEGQLRLMLGVLNYILFGKEYSSRDEVEKTHFDVICKKIDEDAITLPAHSMMVQLVVKYGLFQKIKDKITD
jgi:hypothetical protein